MSNINAGDTVIVKPTDERYLRWSGIRCTVLKSSPSKCYLNPLSDRPDGLKRHNFWWGTDEVHVIPTYSVEDWNID